MKTYHLLLPLAVGLCLGSLAYASRLGGGGHAGGGGSRGGGGGAVHRPSGGSGNFRPSMGGGGGGGHKPEFSHPSGGSSGRIPSHVDRPNRNPAQRPGGSGGG